MKLRNLFCGVIAAAMAFVACVQEQNLILPNIVLSASEFAVSSEAGDTTLTLTATRDWTVTVGEDAEEWIAVDPVSGSTSEGAQTITISYFSNDGYDREGTIAFSIGMRTRKVTVKQAGVKGSPSVLVLYANDFDKEVAEKTYGSGTSWPYLDQFDGWQNHTGSGVANVLYSFKGMSTRANSTSNSNYSDYEGSGNNNLFFGASAYFAVHNIALGDVKDLALSFGSEKYSQDNGSVFKNSEFHIWLSADSKKWVEFTDYTFAGGTTEGRWNVASATFSVPEGTKTLSICMTVDVASSYRLDDIMLEVADAEGKAVDFSAAVEKDFGTGVSVGGGDNTGDVEAGSEIYSNNFDKTAATKTYGSGDSWPYLDQFDGWQNETGIGAANVQYTYKGTSARANSASNDKYSDYSGSGVNNIFFGSSPYFAIHGIALNGAKDLAISFGTEKYSQSLGSVFKNSEFHIWLSTDSKKWVEFTDYTFAGGTTEGRWNVASATFSVPEGTSTLSICFAVDVASSYRLDDLKLLVSETAGTAVDFTKATDKDFGSVTLPDAGDDSGSGDNGNTGDDNTGDNTGDNSGDNSGDNTGGGNTDEGGVVTGSSLTISRSTITGIEWTTNGYGSQDISSLSTYISWTINGAKFIGAKMCLPPSTNPFGDTCIQCQGNATDAAKQHRFGNTVSLGKITKITVVTCNENYTPNFNLALGASQVVGVEVPSDMIAAADMTTTQDGQTYTTIYEPTEDVGYFAIYKNTAGALYISEVTVEYTVE